MFCHLQSCFHPLTPAQSGKSLDLSGDNVQPVLLPRVTRTASAQSRSPDESGRDERGRLGLLDRVL